MSTQRGDDAAAGHPTVSARDEARLLALLESDETGGLTIAAMRDLGVTAPGQAVYALQLAGHQIERVYCQDSDGNPKHAYRLRASQ
jgi:Helix-turn-helix domain